jgi:hypothetical protein
MLATNSLFATRTAGPTRVERVVAMALGIETVDLALGRPDEPLERDLDLDFADCMYGVPLQ